jgi:hypothetical protein
VNAVGPRGTTALLVACEHGREAIARALLDRGAKVDALKKGLNIESATMLAKIGTEKGIMVSGIKCDQTTADFSNQNLKPPYAILLASDLSQAVVTGGLTVANLLGNQLDVESAKMLAEVAKQKCISLCGIQRDQATADFCDKRLQPLLQPPDAILLASDLSQAVVTGVLTSVDLRANKLMDEGWGAIFAAICGNKDSKIIAMDASSENIGPAGVKLIAEALRTSVTGALTEVWETCQPTAS